MNILKSSTVKKLILPGLLAFSPLLAQGQVITHIDQNFEGFAVGPLTSGSNGWVFSANIAADVVSSPVYQGNRALQLTRNDIGSVTYATDAGPNTSLVLAANKSYQWSFALYGNSATPNSTGWGSYVYLDTGSTSKVFASLLLRWQNSGDDGAAFYIYALNDLSYGTGTAFTLSNYSLLGSVAEDTWALAQFDINIASDQKIGYTVTVGSLSHTVTSQTNQAGFTASDDVRMAWSPQGNGSVVGYDNLYLATVPEPTTAGFLLLSGSICLLARRRKSSLS